MAQDFRPSGESYFFRKDRDLVYTEMCEVAARFSGIEDGVYNPDMRWTDYDLLCGEEVATAIRQQDRELLSTGTKTRASGILEFPGRGWVYMLATKQLDEAGNIVGGDYIFDLEHIHNGWPARLDHARKELKLFDGSVLTLAEMRVAHAYLHGLPQKLIAREERVSVKAIEKRLQRLRDKLSHPGCNCYSLHGCINWHSLTMFLMERRDWFNLTPTYQVYPH